MVMGEIHNMCMPAYEVNHKDINNKQKLAHVELVKAGSQYDARTTMQCKDIIIEMQNKLGLYSFIQTTRLKQPYR